MPKTILTEEFQLKVKKPPYMLHVKRNCNLTSHDDTESQNKTAHIII